VKNKPRTKQHAKHNLRLSQKQSMMLHWLLENVLAAWVVLQPVLALPVLLELAELISTDVTVQKTNVNAHATFLLVPAPPLDLLPLQSFVV
jgi:hypothetical protein